MKRVLPPKGACLVICIGCGRLRKLAPRRKVEDPICKSCGGPFHYPANHDVIMAAFLIGGPEAVRADMVSEHWLRGVVAARELEASAQEGIRGVHAGIIVIDDPWNPDRG